MNRTSRPQSSRPYALWGLFFLSGAASLGYQMLWAKMFALTLGHELPAVIAVVATFFVGMAIGAQFSNAIIERLGPSAFARLEFIIGGLGCLTPILLLKVNAGWAVTLFILPSTISMGATLPAMARFAQTPSAYAANTFGAVVGCLATTFVLMPRLGFIAPTYICAACNFIAALLARSFVTRECDRAAAISKRLIATFFVTGFLALGFETLGVRLLSLSLENTVFTFAAILAVYLFGQSAGAALFRKRTDVIAASLAIAIVASIWLFSASGDIYESMRQTFDDSAFAVALSEVVTAAVIYLAPTFLMGALFAELADKVGQRALGSALFWNSIGACVGAIVVPVALYPAIGAFWILALSAIGYLAVITRWSALQIVAACVALVVLISAPRPLTLVRIPPANTLREVRTGPMATVSVTETPDANRTLFVNNRFQMGGTAARIPELRHTHIPLLLHPAPRSALIIGLGTGISLSAAESHPNLRAEGVELLPEVVAVMDQFFPSGTPSPRDATNITVHTADARRFVRETTNNFDVIIADLFHPAQEGAAFLYTREHFERIRARLRDHGLFCQWLPLHQLDLQTFRDITATFLTAFPNAEAWMLRFNVDAPVVGLIGWRGTPSNAATVEARLPDPKLGPELRRVALADSVRLYGCYIAGADQLRAFSHNARLNTDAFPVVMFEAPAFSYRRTAPTYDRFMAFLNEVAPSVPEFGDPGLKRRVEMFITARNVYLRALVDEAKGERSRAVDAYIDSARVSEDFTSGYAQCIVIATAEANTNPAEARSILEKLIGAQPNRAAAKELLNRLPK